VITASGAAVFFASPEVLAGVVLASASSLDNLVFLGLGVSELASIGQDEGELSPLAQIAVERSAWMLALPMTLNNLAGGVAGGVIGSGPEFLALATLVASFVFMTVGHFVGRLIGGAIPLNPGVAAGIAFVLLRVARRSWRTMTPLRHATLASYGFSFGRMLRPRMASAPQLE